MDERKKRDEPVFNLLIAHFLRQGMMGSWPTDTPKPPPHTLLPTPQRHAPSPLPTPTSVVTLFFIFYFWWPLRRLWTLNEKTVTSTYFRKISSRKLNVIKESAINFQWLFPCVWMDPSPTQPCPLPRWLTIPQGLAGARRFLPTFKPISVIIIFPSVSAEFRFANFMQRITTVALSLSRGGCVVCFFFFLICCAKPKDFVAASDCKSTTGGGANVEMCLLVCVSLRESCFSLSIPQAQGMLILGPCFSLTLDLFVATFCLISQDSPENGPFVSGVYSRAAVGAHAAPVFTSSCGRVFWQS